MVGFSGLNTSNLQQPYNPGIVSGNIYPAGANGSIIGNNLNSIFSTNANINSNLNISQPMNTSSQGLFANLPANNTGAQSVQNSLYQPNQLFGSSGSNVVSGLGTNSLASNSIPALDPSSGMGIGSASLANGTISGLGSGSLGSSAIPYPVSLSPGTSSLGSGTIPTLASSSGMGLGAASAVGSNIFSPLGSTGISGANSSGQTASGGTPTNGSQAAQAKVSQAIQIVKQNADPAMLEALNKSNISFMNGAGNTIGLGSSDGSIQLDQSFVEQQSPERIAVLIAHELIHVQGGDEDAAENVEQQWDNKFGIQYVRD